jgi:hypothetical protein
MDDDSHPNQRHPAAFTACVVIDRTRRVPPAISALLP